MKTPTEQALEFSSFQEFYPYYLSEHSDVNCRRLHFMGTTGVIALFVIAIATANAWWLLATPVMGYGFAWLGHFAFEHNKPATFKFPLYSLAGDWVMYRDILIGRVSLLRS
ncbi:MAG: DUF962 domain-containing protein [Pseudomonadota bacterium]